MAYYINKTNSRQVAVVNRVKKFIPAGGKVFMEKSDVKMSGFAMINFDLVSDEKADKVEKKDVASKLPPTIEKPQVEPKKELEPVVVKKVEGVKPEPTEAKAKIPGEKVEPKKETKPFDDQKNKKAGSKN